MPLFLIPIWPMGYPDLSRLTVWRFAVHNCGYLSFVRLIAAQGQIAKLRGV